MNKLNLVIEHSAEIDLISILEYISKDNKKAALKLTKNFLKSFQFLCSHPNAGKIQDKFIYRNVRFYVAHKHYIIVYLAKNETLHILRILSSCQDICSLLQADLRTGVNELV